MVARFNDAFDFRRPAAATPTLPLANADGVELLPREVQGRGVGVRVRVVAVAVVAEEPCENGRMSKILLAVVIVMGGACGGGDSADLHTLVTCGSSWARFGYSGSATCESPCAEVPDETDGQCTAHAWSAHDNSEVAQSTSCPMSFDFQGVTGCCLGINSNTDLGTYPQFLVCE